MEIELKSEFFKRIFNSEKISGDYSQDPLRLSLYEDSNVPMIKGPSSYKDILEDYSNILANVDNISLISFNGLPNDLVKEFLKIGFPAKKMMIVNSDFDFSTLDDIDPSRFENIEDLHISNVKNKDGKKSKLKHAKVLKKLKNVNLLNCEALDVDSLFEDIPNPEELQDLHISSNLPDPKSVERLKNVKSIYIQGVKDSKSLYNFLEALSLENLTVLSITNCDLENMPDSLVSRLSSLLAFDLNNNTNVNYNSILSALPRKELLVSLELQDVKDNDFDLDISQIEKCVNLKGLKCANFHLDFDKLKEYLGKDTELGRLDLINANVQNLDFLSDARMAIDVDIEQDDIDFGMITPEFVKKQSKLGLTRTKTGEVVEVFYDRLMEDDLERTSRTSIRVNAETLPSIEPIFRTVDKICKTEITVADDLSPVENVLLKYSDKILFCYSLFTSSFSKINEGDIPRLNKNRKLSRINVIDAENDDRQIYDRFAYRIDEYIELKKKIDEITGDIPRDLPDIQKFMIIYRRLGTKISYDYGIVGKNQYSQYAKDNVDNCRNCVNGLMRNTTVCAGYADILYNCLREVGIESYKISGISGEYHQWNKVKIDGEFYNTDLTWDAPDLTKNYVITPLWCLKGDKHFGKKHKEKTGKKDECPKDFDKSKIAEAYKFAMEFDGIKPENIIVAAVKEIIKDARKDIKEFIEEIKKSKNEPKALPAPEKQKSEETPSNNELMHVPSWDLGDRTTEVQAKMAEVSRSVSERSDTQTKELDCK